MIKKVTDIQKQEILESFLKGKTIKELSLIYNFSSQTISRQLKNNLGKEKFEKIKSSIGRKTSSSREKNIKNFKCLKILNKDFQKEIFLKISFPTNFCDDLN